MFDHVNDVVNVSCRTGRFSGPRKKVIRLTVEVARSHFKTSRPRDPTTILNSYFSRRRFVVLQLVALYNLLLSRIISFFHHGSLTIHYALQALIIVA
jgi:hypothetical protein